MDSKVSAVHTYSFPLHANAARIETAVWGSLVCLPLTRNTPAVWDITNVKAEPMSLIGHKSPVSALCFSHDEPILLCSAADDYVIAWNIRKCQQEFARGMEVKGNIVVSRPGTVTNVSFSPDAELIALCVDSVVKIASVSKAKQVAELAGHLMKVTVAEFCPRYLKTLVTISDDRTFKVWDVQQFCLVYQSQIITSAPLISISMNKVEPHVALGSAGGIVKIFDLTDGNNFRQLFHLDVSKIMAKMCTIQKDGRYAKEFASDTPVHANNRDTSISKTTTDTLAEGSGGLAIIESSNSVLNLFYVHTQAEYPQNVSQKSHHAVSNVLCSASPFLAIASTHCLLVIHSRTLEVLAFTSFKEPLYSTFQSTADQKTVGSIGLASTGLINSQQLVTVVGTLFEPQILAVQWKIPTADDTKIDNKSDNAAIQSGSFASDLCGDKSNATSCLADALSMVAVSPLLDDSPLRTELVPKGMATKNGITTHGSTSHRKKKSDPMNQPLTFKSTVKSSGYTQSPCRTMFKPRTMSRSKPKDAETHPAHSSYGLGSKLSSQEYPHDSGPPQEIEGKLKVSTVPTAITSLQFSPSGKSLACSLTNKSMLVFPAPLGKRESSIFIGHEGIVNTVHWSNSGNLLITSADDRSAIVWDRGSGEILLKFSTFSHNFKESQASDRTKNIPYPKEIKGAQFFYVDKFVLLIVCNLLCLYKYHLDASKDDIKRYLVKSKYKLVKQWESPSQSLTALAAVNSFHSHLTLCAGSNRDVEIFDLNVGQQSHVFSNAHAKPVHSIGLNEGSTFTSQPQEAFNVFATSSTMDSIKLWDVRTKSSVMRLEGHINNAYGCGLAFSPCGTYLGSGSEDKLAYVYDLRSRTYCQKLRGHSDVVTTVAFHLAYPLMAAGSTDGTILLYRP